MHPIVHTVPWVHIRLPPNGISVGSSIFAWLTVLPDIYRDAQCVDAVGWAAGRASGL